MKKKILSLVLVLCLCLPLILASCAGSDVMNYSDLINKDAEATMFDSEINKLGTPLSKVYEGTIVSHNESFIIEELARTEEIDGVTKLYLDKNIYNTTTQELLRTITRRVDVLGDVADDELIAANTGFISFIDNEYVLVSSITKGNVYREELIDDKGDVIISYEGKSSASFIRYAGTENTTFAHCVLDNKLYRLEKDKSPILVKDLDLSAVDEKIQNNRPEKSYYKNGKYVFVYESYALIYNESLDKPTYVEMPIKVLETNGVHNETELEMNLNVLENGNLYIMYEVEKRITCDECENSCEAFSADIENAIWVDGEYAYSYKSYVLNIENGTIAQAQAPSFKAEAIIAYDRDKMGKEEANLINENVKNMVEGYEIIDQTITDKMVLYLLDNNGNLGKKVESPHDALLLFPYKDNYIAFIDGIVYLLDKDYNILNECPNGYSVGTTFYVDGCLYDMSYNLVKKLDENYEYIDRNNGVFVFLETTKSVDEDGNEQEIKTYVLINEKGEEVSRIQTVDNLEIYDIEDDFVAFANSIYDELGILIGKQVLLYDNTGRQVTTYNVSATQNSVVFDTCDNGINIIYMSQPTEGTDAKYVSMLVPFLVESGAE